MATPEEIQTEEEVPIEALELSDEDFMKLDGPPEDPAIPEEVEKEVEEVVKAEVEEEVIEPEKKVEAPLTLPDGEIDTELKKEIDSLELDKKVPPTETDPDKKVEPEVKPGAEEKVEPKKEEDKKVKPAGIDYKAEYEKMTATFKANGHEMAVKNSDDAIRLMQMGANYHKKMAGLKPSMRILKLLEKNNLMDESNLNFLIDLHNKNPEAITKLVKDSGMDPLDVDVKKDSKYVPTQHTVNDSELDLDAVLEDIQSTPTYQDTMNVITNVWDQASRNIIANTPQIISTINGHVADGTYKKVMAAVTYERSMGKLAGISDIQAYKEMGDQLFAAGQIGQTEPAAEAIVEPAVPPIKIDSQTEVKRKERKKAVSPTKNVGTPAAVSYNPLSMSDDDFAKIDPNDFKVK